MQHSGFNPKARWDRHIPQVEENLGKYGLNLYIALHSSDCFDISQSEEKPKSIGHSYTLPRPSKTSRFMQAWLRLLSEMVASRLRQNNLVSYTVHLWLNGPEIGSFGAQKTFQQATNDGYEIYLRALKIMPKIGQKTPKIRALGVICSNLCGSKYPPLFKEQKKREDLIEALDQINRRYGEDSIFPAVTILTRKME